MTNQAIQIDYLAQLEKDMVLVEAKNKTFRFQDEVGITFDCDYHICKYPVTQGLWKAVMNGKNPSNFKGDYRPVERVSWDDITNDFLPKLRKITGINYRLPSETQWEYAASGGEHWKDAHTYSGSNRLKEVGWYEENSHYETKPVGLKLPNRLDLYDMSGNVWEWCQDKWNENISKNGKPLEEGGKDNLHVVRGGSWLLISTGSHVASHNCFNSDDRINSIGFRLSRY